MKHFACQISLTLAAFALLGLARPGPALAAEMVPFKATMGGPNPVGEVVPFDPPLVVAVYHSTGQATLLGDFKYVEAFTVHLGVDGKPLSAAGIGAFTAANGDAIFVTDSALFRPTPPNEGVWIITGGKGRFAGATGSGVLINFLDPVKNENHCTFEGVISAPKQQ